MRGLPAILACCLGNAHKKCRLLQPRLLCRCRWGITCPLGTLKELLSGSDFVTLHVPASKETNNMISRWELMHMRKGRCIEPPSDIVNPSQPLAHGPQCTVAYDAEMMLKEQALKV